MKRILLIEDNVDMALAVVKYFMHHDYQVEHYSSYEEAVDKLGTNFDCYILDINLPKKNGFEAARLIRKIDPKTPLIAITARDEIDDKLKGFEVGFNDYVVKPFDLRELLARVNTHVRQLREDNDEIKTKDFKINFKEYTAYYKNKKLDLTNIEFRILFMLVKHANILVQLDDLIEYAWGDDPDIFNPPIRMHISNLRKKINDDDYTIIETIPGIGYKLKN